MNYDKFRKDYDQFEEWNSDNLLDIWDKWDEQNKKVEYLHPFGQIDMVNSPAHYTRGKQEAIEIIEEAIQDAPDVKAGMLQAQTLKYLLRLWLKGNSIQDSKKAQWYLTRLIDHLDSTALEE